ncbi:MAG TPA: vitamin K epoxide reductase family protein [Abditibacterium sp.]|jgi:uncharacterized membrane protein
MQAQVSAPLEKTAAKTHVAWPHVVLAVLGIAISIYAVWAHGRVEAGQATGCSISETISCDAVLGSKWAKFAGIPLGYFGIIFWAIVGITAISSAGSNLKTAALQRLAIGTVGIAFSVVLFVIAEFVIRKTCPICLSTHICSLVNFVFSVVGWRRVASTKTLESI